MRIKLPIYPRPAGARKQNGVNGRKKRETWQTSAVTAPVSPAYHGYVKSDDGTKLFYSVEGKGKPLVFCYGLVCSSLHWTYQIEHFKKTHRVVWFDYRGHQNSEVPRDPKNLTLNHIAQDLTAVLNELEIQEAVLLGHSMGVNVVLEFYKKHPERLVGMVLANGTAKRPLETAFRHNILQTGFKFFKMFFERSPELCSLFWKSQKGNPLAKTLVSLGGFNPHLTPQADIELYIEQVARTDPGILIRLIENYETYDATPWLHTVETPTLIIAGEHDKLVPVDQQELIHQLIGTSQLEVIRHGSHCPQMDLPDLVNFKIEKFLDQINYGPIASPSKESASRSTVQQQSLDPTEAV